ncbi:hypothetical protein JW992_14695 [candidate division KSB1 bacterium]|nr:hypothetical protein [candidate division KSB1 bacterium]
MQLKPIKSIISIVILLFGTLSVSAGEYAADFLHIGVGARPLSMGGAFTALAGGDASAFYWNPAGLLPPKRLAAQFEHVSMFGGLAQYNAANAVLNLNDQFAIGLSWIRLGVDEIPRYSELQGTRLDRLSRNHFRSTGEPEGYFGDTEDAVLVSLSQTFYLDLYVGDELSGFVLPLEISWGVSGKYIRQKLDTNSGTGQGLDAGVLFRLISNQWDRTEPLSWIGFGAIVRDVAHTSVQWNTASNHSDAVGIGLQIGAAISHTFRALKSRLTLAADRAVQPYALWRAGCEWKAFETLALRGGLVDADLTAGAGLSLFGFTADYAFVSHELDNSHRVSIAYHF